MSDKFGLIRDVEEQARTPKLKYQVFEVRINASVYNAVIPFESADAFLEEISSVQPSSRSILSRLVEDFTGEIE
jgi:hypothetical protein